MKPRIREVAMLAGGLLVGASAWAAGPTPAMLTNACGGCHGTNGSSAGPSMPTIAGQPAVTTIEAMKQFKSGERPSSIMGRIAKGYSDQEIEAMANYLEKQKFGREGQKVDAAKVATGKSLADRHCRKCHLEGGREFDEKANVLAGQWLEYLQIQMADYASGARKMSEKKAEKMKPLSREELDALAHYYASQR